MSHLQRATRRLGQLLEGPVVIRRSIGRDGDYLVEARVLEHRFAAHGADPEQASEAMAAFLDYVSDGAEAQRKQAEENVQ